MASNHHPTGALGTLSGSSSDQAPSDCPKWSRCNAPICPLDSDWRTRRMLKGEPICAYLLEASRYDGRLPERVNVTRTMRLAIAVAYLEIKDARYPIQPRLRRAAAAGPRLGRKPGKQDEC